jgi:hypothetical protein
LVNGHQNHQSKENYAQSQLPQHRHQKNTFSDIHLLSPENLARPKVNGTHEGKILNWDHSFFLEEGKPCAGDEGIVLDRCPALWKMSLVI